MPLQYRFQLKPFKCELKCQICNYKRPGTNRCCKVKVCVGIPYCRYHMQQAVKLEIKDSEYGKGVFAKADPIQEDGGRRRTRNNNNNNRQPVFRSGVEIIEYGGERITKAELHTRYGKNTAPYAIEMGNRNQNYHDGACVRTIGTLINHNARNPNVEFSQAHNGSPITITATRDIYDGQQLYANYGDDYEFEDNVVSKTTIARRRGAVVAPSRSECMRTEERRRAAPVQNRRTRRRRL